MSADTHRITMRPIIPEERHYHSAYGPMYSALYDGEVIVESTRLPLLEGARVLQASGLTCAVELWDEERLFPRICSTIEAASASCTHVHEAGACPLRCSVEAARLWHSVRPDQRCHRAPDRGGED